MNFLTKNEIQCKPPHVTFIFTSTNKPVDNVANVVNALQNYIDGKLSVQNRYLSAPLRQICMNCSSARTKVVTGDPSLQLDNTL